jgi:CRISPR/Cas system-associated endoribonuclease Cas2
MAKTLARHGCHRVQYSVFLAPFMDQKDHVKMLADVQKISQSSVGFCAKDSVLVVSIQHKTQLDLVALGTDTAVQLLTIKKLMTII